MLKFKDGTEINPGRVFCIGGNYGEHIRELGHGDVDQCIIFMKPTQSLVNTGEKISIPRNRGRVDHEVELVALLSGGGCDVSPDNALNLLQGLSLGLDLTLRDEQNRLRNNGHPWELCKAFEQSAPIGDFTPFSSELHPGCIDFSCSVNGDIRQKGHSADMIFSLTKLISIISRIWSLSTGDLIYTGTPPGVGPIYPGDVISIESPQLGTFRWDII